MQKFTNTYSDLFIQEKSNMKIGYQNYIPCPRQLLFIGLFITLLPVVSFASAKIQTIETLEYFMSDVGSLPDAHAHWQPYVLPFASRPDPLSLKRNSLETRWIWFRFKINKPEDDNTYAFLLWRLNLAAQIYFNGEYIGGSRERAGYTALSWNRPLLVNIQTPVWREGENEVLIRLARERLGANLAPVLFGESAELTSLYESRLFRQVEVNKVLLAFGFLLSIITFFVWLRRREDTVYLWFGVMALSWSMVTIHMVTYFSPLPYRIWLPLIHIAIDVCILCLHGFVVNMSEIRVIWRGRAFVVWTLFAAIVHLLIPSHLFFLIAYIIHLIGALVLGFTMIQVISKALRTKESTIVVISIAVVIQVLLFIYNAMLMFLDNSVRWEKTMFLAHFGIPVLLAIFGAVLLKRFIDSLNEVEALNQDLELKVEASRAIIEKQFAERREFELQQTAEHERQKIYRDLHDDVGSRLLSIIHADRDSKLGDTARVALESLRQAVSRANTPNQLFTTFISDVREETELRLRGSGHEVYWEQANDIPGAMLPSELVFNLNRILKEVVSNIIRHANASCVEVRISKTNDGKNSWSFFVRDNGCGFGISDHSGNGMRNIQTRAQEIGAMVKWENAEPGIRFSISLDMPIR